jgi:hypothetical protein
MQDEEKRGLTDQTQLAMQIERLLNYPKVGPLGADAIAINLGTDRRRIEPILLTLVDDRRVKQVRHDRQVEYIGSDVERDRE